MLSPSLLSLHDQGDYEEKLTSVPRLLKTLIGEEEYADWLNFVAETSGAADSIQRVEKQLSETDLPAAWTTMPRGIDGQPLYFTKQNISELDAKQNDT
ncbi:unnamed protein product, partial [Gongylonema pulchrum]|uniref:Oligopeptidase A n=1 Tax=Gongylonema pulchrum TaxID=637853 RepID=A0A183EPX9_9BILA